MINLLSIFNLKTILFTISFLSLLEIIFYLNKKKGD